MKATELFRQRIVYFENRFAELVLWRLPQPLPGLKHPFKCRLAYVVALLKAGLLCKTAKGAIEFPYDAVKVEFLLQAA